MDEASLEPSTNNLKKLIEKLDKVLENKKPLCPQDEFVPKFKKFCADSLKKLKMLESMLEKYQKELNEMKLLYFEESTKVTVEHLQHIETFVSAVKNAKADLEREKIEQAREEAKQKRLEEEQQKKLEKQKNQKENDMSGVFHFFTITAGSFLIGTITCRDQCPMI